MGKTANRSLFFGIGLQLYRWRCNSRIIARNLRICGSAHLLDRSHGAITVERHTFGDKQSRRLDIANQTRRRQQFNFFLGSDVAFDFAVDHHGLPRDLGAYLGAVTDSQRRLAVNFSVYGSVDPGRPLKTQLSADSTPFIQVTSQPGH